MATDQAFFRVTVTVLRVLVKLQDTSASGMAKLPDVVPLTPLTPVQDRLLL